MKTVCRVCIAKGVIALSLFLVGCASGNGGQIVSVILQGIGQGLAGLYANNIVKLR